MTNVTIKIDHLKCTIWKHILSIVAIGQNPISVLHECGTRWKKKPHKISGWGNRTNYNKDIVPERFLQRMRGELWESRGIRTKLEANEEGAIPRKGRHGTQGKPEKNWETFSITKTKKWGNTLKMVENNKALL